MHVGHLRSTVIGDALYRILKFQGHTVTEGGVERSTIKVSVLWPAMAYIALTFGEVLLYGTMLELANHGVDVLRDAVIAMG